MDHTGAVLKKVRTFKQYPEAFDKEMILADQADAEKVLATLNGLRDKIAKNPGDNVAKATLTIELFLRHGGNSTDEDLKTAAATPGVDADLVKRATDYLEKKALSAAIKKADKPAQDVMQKAIKMMQADPSPQTTGKAKAIAYLQVTYTKMFKDGLRLHPKGRLNVQYFTFVMQAAVKAKDVETAAAVVTAAKATGNDNWVTRFNKELQGLKDSMDSEKEDGAKEAEGDKKKDDR